MTISYTKLKSGDWGVRSDTAIKEGVRADGPVWERFGDSPEFDDTTAAIKWAQDNHLSGTLRVVVVKAVFELITEDVKVTKVKPVTP